MRRRLEPICARRPGRAELTLCMECTTSACAADWVRPISTCWRSTPSACRRSMPMPGRPGLLFGIVEVKFYSTGSRSIFACSSWILRAASCKFCCASVAAWRSRGVSGTGAAECRAGGFGMGCDDIGAGEAAQPESKISIAKVDFIISAAPKIVARRSWLTILPYPALPSRYRIASP